MWLLNVRLPAAVGSSLQDDVLLFDELTEYSGEFCTRATVQPESLSKRYWRAWQLRAQEATITFIDSINMILGRSLNDVPHLDKKEQL